MSSALDASGSSTIAVEDQLSTMAFAAMILQVTGCASMLCSAGTCVVAPEGPVCDCEGTGMEGPHCTDPLSPSTSASLSASPSPVAAATTEGGPRGVASTSPSQSPSPSSVPSRAPRLMPCPGRVGLSEGNDCSGRGECVRSQPGCTEDNVDCIAVCRWAFKLTIFALTPLP